MAGERYIHIRNWERFQHPDAGRTQNRGLPWIKGYTAQLTDEDYVELTFADRGLLESLRLQYATNRGRGINEVSTNLHRLFGQRVRKEQLERLNHAGFIYLSASKYASNMQAQIETERKIETEKEIQPQGLTVARDATGPGQENLKTGGPNGDRPSRRVHAHQEDANGLDPTPSQSDHPLGAPVSDELARLKALFDR